MSSQKSFEDSAKRHENEEIDRDKHEENIRPEVKRLLTSYLEALDTDCESIRHHVQMLNNLYYRGDLDLSQAEKTIVLRDELSTLVGMWTNTRVRFERQSTSDWAYIDSLLARMRTPSRATLSLFKLKDVNEQRRFRTTAIKAYGADFSINPDLIWCCISDKFRSASTIVAAYTVPYNIGEVVLLRGSYGDSRLEEIDRKVLQFQTMFRPVYRHLYFTFVVSLLQVAQFISPGQTYMHPLAESPKDRLAADYVSVVSSSRGDEDNDDDDDPFIEKRIQTAGMFSALKIEEDEEDEGDEEDQEGEDNEEGD
ncbi:hypothetical protein AYL99_11639 [Fonsecaea erecta]|uniref:HNH nuclease domain-containing protein n=1 Tax=Fonsecaea erecta TaxID=1367422 RepID=A0A178Z325_9EURO|nr:hypothetical protein AYL99_11639 [Fonsecaea erecta]OAP54104.1 hypothetical protein AYL99_11639 [Fonsecaea erecta]